MTEPERTAVASPEEKRALLDRLLREKARRPQVHPVSFGQQRLWFLDRLEPDTTGYAMPAALRVHGPLNVDALAASFRELARRHAILRTTIANVEGEPRQLVHPTATLDPDFQDLSGHPEAERERAAISIVASEVARPFDLEQGPLCRVRLLRLGSNEHVLLINLHHIATDGWSTSILLRELVTLYVAALTCEPAPLPPLPVQYSDYARWQRAWLEADGFRAEMDYWRNQLAGPLPKLELTPDHPRPATLDFRGGSCARQIQGRTVAALLRIGRGEGATLFMTLLASFNLLLSRLCNQEDVVVGTAVSGRQRAEIEPLIGFFVNTLVLRTDLSGSPSFLELLRRVKNMTLDALAHQTVPFEKLVEELRPERSAGRNPLFEILFNFGNMPRATLAPGEISLEQIELGDIQAKHAITLYADASNDTIALSLVYQRALFDPPRMEALLAQYCHLLEQIAETPDASIESFSLRPPETQSKLPGPQTPLATVDYEPVTETFRRFAERTPAQIAVSQSGREHRYGELLLCARAISASLAAEGFRAGDTVAVLGPRSFGLIAAIVAVMQIGGVLLLIDRTHPPARRKALIAEGRSTAIVAVCERDEPREDEPSELRTVRVRASDGSVLGAAAPSPEPPQGVPSGDDPAYICFTSGSTGVPKGVLGAHRGLAHFLAWEREAFQVSPSDRVSQLSRLSFDVAMRDIFLPLTSGATLCLPPDQTRFDTGQVLNWLQAEAVSIVHIVPAVAAAGLATATPDITLEKLRWALFAGEPLTEQLVNRWRDAFPRSGGIANLYGPTETTLAKFCHLVGDPPGPGIQPVGQPLPHTQALVVNRAGQLCGVGEPGEVFIRTPYRSLGYINLPEAQAERFIVNPFGTDPGDLVYRTGDLGRHRVDGALELQGRTDHQIKIGGVRIEPAEIESVISGHPEVAACVVVATGEGDVEGEEDRRLTAYVAAKPGCTPSLKSVRAVVRRELPKHQHPSRFVFLDSLPLLANGKVDRAGLPPPGSERPDPDEPYVAPRTELEGTLARIWEEVLKIAPVGIHDDFFDLGGHSLMAVRLMFRINKGTGAALPLATLFEHATIEKLARLVVNPLARSAEPLVAVQPGGRERPLFFVHPAGGDVMCYGQLAARLGKGRPFYGLQSLVSDPAKARSPAIEDMAAHYLDAIIGVQPSGPYLLGGWSMGAIVAFEMAQQLVDRGHQVALLALLDHRPPVAADADELFDDVAVMRRFLASVGELESAPLEGLTGERRFERFLELARQRDLLPAEVGEEQVRSYLEVYRANVEAVRRYSPRRYPGRVTLLRTRFDDPDGDTTLGWGSFAQAGVDVFEVPGTHHQMVSEPNVETVARVLRSCLAEVEGKTASTPPRDVPSQRLPVARRD
jgi:amino acid adenylation domain-containing protein